MRGGLTACHLAGPAAVAICAGCQSGACGRGGGAGGPAVGGACKTGSARLETDLPSLKFEADLTGFEAGETGFGTNLVGFYNSGPDLRYFWPGLR